MNSRFASGFLAALLIFMLMVSTARANTAEQIFVQVSPSVVVVDIFDAKGKSIGLGSGAVIGVGLVITNCHVAQMGKSLQVRQSGKTFKATLQYADPDRDLCQLSVPDLQAPPVALGTANKLRVGQRVYAIGAPEGLELTLSEGLISSLRKYEGSQYIQTSAAISPGSSGGGLFDDQGRLVGITAFQLIEGQNLNFALPVDWIAELPKRAQTASKAAKKGGLDWFNRAAALEQKKDWQGLLTLSQQWVKSEPKNPITWFGLGLAYYNLNQYKQAIHAYREALRIEPDLDDAWYNLGLAYSSAVHGKHYLDKVSEIYENLRRLDSALAEQYFETLTISEQSKLTQMEPEAPQKNQTSSMTGQKWMNMMNTAIATPEEYTTAMVLVGDILFGWEGKSHCKPPEVTVGQAVAVTQKFMNENPELWHYPAPDLIGVALGNAWPCQKRGKGQ